MFGSLFRRRDRSSTQWDVMALSDFIGRQVLLSIGEPWDFSSSDGENVLRGTIVGETTGLLGNPSLILDVNPFELDGQFENQLTASSRYVGHTLLGDLTKHGAVTANFHGVSTRVGLIGSLSFS